MSIERKLIFFKRKFGSYIKHGDEYLFLCPMCRHTKPKLSINFKNNKYKCWTCEKKFAGNNITTLVKRFCNSDYPEWLKIFGDKNLKSFSDVMSRVLQPPLEEFEIEVISLPKAFRSLVRRNHTLDDKEVLYYLNRRLVDYEDVCKWRLGYVPKNMNSRFKGRVIVPSCDRDGRLNYFVGRTYVGDNIPYLNPKIDKRSIIFNHLNIDFNKDVVLTEGVFDAMKAENSIPMLGSSSDIERSAKLIFELINNDTKIFLAFDSDAFAREMKIAKKLMSYGLRVYKVKTNDIEDLGSLTKEDVAERKRRSVQLNLDFLSEFITGSFYED